MQKSYLLTALLLIFSIVYTHAQTTLSTGKNGEQQKENIRSEEKEKLKSEILAINKKYENDEITFEQAEKLKKEVATKYAQKIDERISALKTNKPSETIRKIKPARRTQTGIIVFAAGLNNAIQQGQSLNNSDYKVWGSRFAEIGFASTTRLSRQSNYARVVYGLNVQFNGLKPTDKRYFVNNNKMMELREHPETLKKSKLNVYNLVAPVHFEFGPSKKIERNGKYEYKNHKQFKIGIGGYAGINISGRQKLKYSYEGKIKKEKIKGDYELNNFIYGISGYVGCGNASLYAKYDLNPLFKSPNAKQNNISLGIRFDSL